MEWICCWNGRGTRNGEFRRVVKQGSSDLNMKYPVSDKKSRNLSSGENMPVTATPFFFGSKGTDSVDAKVGALFDM